MNEELLMYVISKFKYIMLESVTFSALNYVIITEKSKLIELLTIMTSSKFFY
jgi:endonuclease V-like protein UPF0215 family